MPGTGRVSPCGWRVGCAGAMARRPQRLVARKVVRYLGGDPAKGCNARSGHRDDLRRIRRQRGAAARGGRRRHPVERDHEPDRRPCGLRRRRAGDCRARPCGGHRSAGRARSANGRDGARRSRRHRGRGRPRARRRRHGGPHDRQGPRPRPPEAARRRQPPRRPCVDGAAHRQHRVPLSSASRFGRPHATHRGPGHRRLQAARHDGRRRGRRGLRQDRQASRPRLSRRSCRGARRGNRKTRRASRCRARCSDDRSPISRSPG